MGKSIPQGRCVECGELSAFRVCTPCAQQRFAEAELVDRAEALGRRGRRGRVCLARMDVIAHRIDLDLRP